jgi:hypothetical protein
MTNDDGLSWLPLLEAAMRLGKSTDAVRSLIRRDRVPTRKGNDGRLLVGVPTVDGQATDGASMAVAGARPGLAPTAIALSHRPAPGRPVLATAIPIAIVRH